MLDHPMAHFLLSLSLVYPFIFKRNSPRIFKKAQAPISALEDSSQPKGMLPAGRIDGPLESPGN